MSRFYSKVLLTWEKVMQFALTRINWLYPHSFHEKYTIFKNFRYEYVEEKHVLLSYLRQQHTLKFNKDWCKSADGNILHLKEYLLSINYISSISKELLQELTQDMQEDSSIYRRGPALFQTKLEIQILKVLRIDFVFMWNNSI